LTIRIRQKAWRSHVHKFLKTKNGKREVDLHPTVAALLKTFIGERKSSLFPSRTGKPLEQSNILRRRLHPILVKLGQPKSGAHAFRRFRNTYLKNRTSCPEAVRQFWMGWEGKDMSDLYDKIREDVAFRRE
jgi:integrase